MVEGKPLTLNPEQVTFLRENYGKMRSSKISEQLGLPRWRLHNFISRNWEKLELPRVKSRGITSIQFDRTPQPTLAYILGVLYGDGYVQFAYISRILLQVKDKEFAESFKSALEAIGLHPGPIRLDFWHAEHKGASPRYTVQAYGKPFCEWFKGLTFDDAYKLLQTDKMKRELIRGFYESNGCLSYRKKKNCWIIQIGDGNLEIINLVQRVLKDLGFNFHLYRDLKHHLHPYFTLVLYKKKFIKQFLLEINSCIPRKALARIYGQEIKI